MFSSMQTQLLSIHQLEGPCQAQPLSPCHVASYMQVLAVACVIFLHSGVFTAEICATACEMFLLSHSSEAN